MLVLQSVPKSFSPALFLKLLMISLALKAAYSWGRFEFQAKNSVRPLSVLVLKPVKRTMAGGAGMAVPTAFRVWYETNRSSVPKMSLGKVSILVMLN